jgi:glutamate-1-semialdehyde 2,1-aminomutase
MDNAVVRGAALQLFPGGVNSPVRSFRSVGGNPIPIVRGEGPFVYDGEGNRFIDYIAAFGPLILGHANPAIVEAVQRAAASGTAFGALTRAEVDLGLRVQQATKVERLRFVNSGTEATMTAIRLARAATGRDIVVKFDGCYHGHSDGLLVKAGSGVATLGLSDSAGVPDAIAGLTAVLPYNDPAALKRWFAQHSDDTAAVIVEPSPAIWASSTRPDFLAAPQTAPASHGALLIADEVITGFRLRYGLSDLLPGADLVCLGKVIGGGLPVGAFGGAPAHEAHRPGRPRLPGRHPQRQPLVMAAGIAMLDALQDGKVYLRIDELARHLENGLRTAIRRTEAPASVTRVGSMVTLFFRPERPRLHRCPRERHEDVRALPRRHARTRHHAPPSQFETWFVSAAHTEAGSTPPSLPPTRRSASPLLSGAWNERAARATLRLGTGAAASRWPNPS